MIDPKKTLSAEDLLASYQGHASLLARGIIFGFVPYERPLSRDVVIALCEEMMAHLRDTVEDMPTRLLARAQNALAWAGNPLAEIDLATVFGFNALTFVRTVDRDTYKTLKTTDGFRAYRARCRPFLPNGMRL